MKFSDRLGTPHNWIFQYDEVKEVELSRTSSEYQTLKSKLAGHSSEWLSRITRVQNPYLYHRYMIRKLEYQSLGIPFNEYQLFHATAESKIPSIIKDNLDWRLVSRAKFGKGVSFSNSSVYANKYCARSNGMSRAMIIAKVIVGRKYNGSYSTTVPPVGYDTTYGNGDSVIVKYYDDEFYPEYVAYYTDGLSLLRLYL